MRSRIIAILSLMKCCALKFGGCHGFKFTLRNLLFPGVYFDFGKKSIVVLGDKFSCRRNVQIKVQDNAKLCIGDRVFINTNSVITCHGCIEIGNDVKFGPGTIIFDHDHNYLRGKITKDYSVSNIVIGDDVWFGANCVILRGTKIGAHCVFGAGCILKGNYAENSFVVQKRETTVKALDDYSCSLK